MLARSKAGHDKGKVYVCLGVEEPYCYLTDGKSRVIDNPKRKKLKHIQPIYHLPKDVQDALLNTEVLKNEDIIRILKYYAKTCNKEN